MARQHALDDKSCLELHDYKLSQIYMLRRDSDEALSLAHREIARERHNATVEGINAG